MGINYYRSGLTLNIAYSCGIAINNSIDSTNNRHHVSGLPYYIVNIARMMPQIFKNNFKTRSCLQLDFSFPDNTLVKYLQTGYWKCQMRTTNL